MNSRRKFLKRSFLVFSSAIGAGFLMGGCSSNSASSENRSSDPKTPPAPQNTQDSSAMTKEDIDKRRMLGYVDKTPIAENHCSNCALYMLPKEGSKSGGCQLFKGPVNANGYCTYWAAPQQ